MSIDIHKNLEAIKQVAISKAKEHGFNYNIIILNAVDGKFDFIQSTYEIVSDTYFLTNRPHIQFLHKTDDLIKGK